MAQLITPYLRVRKKMKPNGYSLLACTNKKCDRHGEGNNQDKFCGGCGTKIGFVEIENLQRHRIEELENYEDQFIPVDTHEGGHDIYIWNYKEFTNDLRPVAYSYQKLWEEFFIRGEQVKIDIHNRCPALFQEMKEKGFEYTLEYGIVGHYG